MIDDTTGETAIHMTGLRAEGLLAMRPKHHKVVTRSGSLVALIACLTFSLPVSAKLYKWVDDQGITHYGETIPPEYAGKERVQLDKAGHVIKKEEVITPEARQAQKEAEEKKRAEDKAAQEKKRRDLTLTNTYSNVKEIDLARNRSLQQVDARIFSVNSQLRMSNDTLMGLQKEADGYNKSNKPIPASLNEDLQDAQKRSSKLQLTIDKLKAERSSVEARYADDKARYQELTGK